MIRALRAKELGLLDVLVPDGELKTATMVEALKKLPQQPKPSVSLRPDMLGGLDYIGGMARRILGNGIDAGELQLADL